MALAPPEPPRYPSSPQRFVLLSPRHLCQFGKLFPASPERPHIARSNMICASDLPSRDSLLRLLLFCRAPRNTLLAGFHVKYATPRSCSRNEREQAVSLTLDTHPISVSGNHPTQRDRQDHARPRKCLSRTIASARVRGGGMRGRCCPRRRS